MTWTAKRWLKGITDEVWRIDPAVRFEIAGGPDDIWSIAESESGTGMRHHPSKSCSGSAATNMRP